MTKAEALERGKVRVGTSVLTRDLVWCECGRGLSLSGKWNYCPSCGRKIDQASYQQAIEEAFRNGARLYRDPDADRGARIDELQRMAPHTITDLRAYVNDRVRELEAGK